MKPRATSVLTEMTFAADLDTALKYLLHRLRLATCWHTGRRC